MLSLEFEVKVSTWTCVISDPRPLWLHWLGMGLGGENEMEETYVLTPYIGPSPSHDQLTDSLKKVLDA